MPANENEIISLPQQPAMTEAPRIAVQSLGDTVRQIGFAKAVNDVLSYSPVIDAIPTVPEGGSAGMFLQTDGTTVSWQHVITVRLYARNSTGSTITKGSVVYVSGADGNHPLLSKALATTDPLSSKTIGILEQDLANNADGYVVCEGFIDGMDTNGITNGAQLWLSATTAGAYTTTKPTAPNHLVFIGFSIKASAGNGRIYVKPQNGFEIDELHDVLITTPANNEVLTYESSTGLWKNKAVSGTGTVTSVAATGANGIGVSGSPITGAGTLALSLGAITPSSVAATGTVAGRNVEVKGATGDPVAGALKLFEAPDNGSNAISLFAPSDLSASTSYEWPAADGTSGQVLKTSGSGTLSWSNVALANVSGLGTGVSTFLATPSSANLAAAVTDETGSGKVVFADTTVAPTTNQVMKWNGSTWVPGSITNATEFSFLVTTFSVTPGTSPVEIGSGTWKTAGNLTFSATYQYSTGMTAASIQISGTGVTAWASALSLSSPYTSGTSALDTLYPTPGTGSYRTMTFTITGTRGAEAPTRTVNIAFANRRYWGTSTKSSGYTEADVEGLGSNELTTTRLKSSFTATAGSGAYVIFATPFMLGAATFVDNATGFAFSMATPETVSVTNASGYTENYYVYRSTYANLGSVDVKVN